MVHVGGVGGARGAAVVPVRHEGGQRCTDALVRAREKHAEDDPVALARVDGDGTGPGAGERTLEDFVGAGAAVLGEEVKEFMGDPLMTLKRKWLKIAKEEEEKKDEGGRRRRRTNL